MWMTFGDRACSFEQGQLNVDPELQFRQVSASPGDFACGVTIDNDVKCWGDNRRGQATPPNTDEFILVSTSRLAACGLKVSHVNACITALLPRRCSLDWQADGQDGRVLGHALRCDCGADHRPVRRAHARMEPRVRHPL